MGEEAPGVVTVSSGRTWKWCGTDRHEMLWKVRGKRRIEEASWEEEAALVTAFFRCFSRWALGVGWLYQVEGTAKARREKPRCSLGITK